MNTCGSLTIPQVLPEVTRERWEYGGEAKVDDDTVDTWVFKSEPGKGYGHYTSNYTLSVSKVRNAERHCSRIMQYLWDLHLGRRKFPSE